MSRIILLDSKPLGFVTNPRSNPDAEMCRAWMRELLEQKDRFLVPEIIDYELRRELLRANKSQGIHNLDRLKLSVGYLPLNYCRDAPGGCILGGGAADASPNGG